MNDVGWRLVLQADTAAARAFKDTLREIREEGEKLEQTTTRATASTRGFNAAALEAARGLEDFAVSGVRGVTNNLNQMAFVMGASGPAMIAITALTVGVDLLVRNWDGLMAAVGERTPIADSADALTRLESQLRATTKEVDALREKQKLSGFEHMVYNDLIEEQAQLESDLRIAKQQRREEDERDAANQKARNLQTGDQQRQSQAFTQAMQNAGGFDEAVRQVSQARVQAFGLQGMDPDELRRSSEDMVRQGMERGDMAGFLGDLLGTQGMGMAGDFRDIVAGTTPDDLDREVQRSGRAAVQGGRRARRQRAQEAREAEREQERIQREIQQGQRTVAGAIDADAADAARRGRDAAGIAGDDLVTRMQFSMLAGPQTVEADFERRLALRRELERRGITGQDAVAAGAEIRNRAAEGIDRQRNELMGRGMNTQKATLVLVNELAAQLQALAGMQRGNEGLLSQAHRRAAASRRAIMGDAGTMQGHVGGAGLGWP